MKTEIFADKVPKCTITSCEGGVVKPNIIFFGENLPGKVLLTCRRKFGFAALGLQVNHISHKSNCRAKS